MRHRHWDGMGSFVISLAAVVVVVRTNRAISRSADLNISSLIDK